MLPSGNDMYSEDEVDSFREQLDDFSEKELEMAIMQAKKDILDELKEYQVVEFQEIKVAKEKVKPNIRKININVKDRVCSETTESLDKTYESEEDSTSHDYSESFEESTIDAKHSENTIPDVKQKPSLVDNSQISKILPKGTKTLQIMPKPPTKCFLVQHVTSKPNIESKHNSRLVHCLVRIEAVFRDIFAAVDVNKSSVPKDVLEEERVSRRMKEFNSRLGRTLYQTKEDFSNLKNLILKSH